MMNTGAGTATICLNKKVWDSFSPDIQKVFDELSPITMEAQRNAADALIQQAINTCKEKGVEVIYPSADEMKRLKNAVAFLENDWAKEMDAKGLPGTKLLTDIRQLLPK